MGRTNVRFTFSKLFPNFKPQSLTQEEKEEEEEEKKKKMMMMMMMMLMMMTRVRYIRNATAVLVLTYSVPK
jgi:hypothetical protein